MKVMAFVGSPRKDGNTAQIVDAICKGVEESGHEVEMYQLSELHNEGCIACDACQSGKVEFCSKVDKLSELLPKIAEADCLIIGTPIYMVQVSGIMKNFLERLRPFLNPDLSANRLPGKKYVTVTCSGAPAAVFSNVTEYLNDVFDYFKMKNVGKMIVGELHDRNDITNLPRIIEEARELGRKLS